MAKKHTLRTEVTAKKYMDYIASGGLKNRCVLCDKESIIPFQHWKIILNDFPYDRVANIHHMLVPLRHCTEDELTEEEWDEYRSIKKNNLDLYEFLLEATEHIKSIPQHFHVHLLRIKEID